ncbi:hypothetical protein XI03_05145 [Bradyrhizobium sp. CCBAU 65884]|nr:hypothetical protein [Bradyrhizobium sp. CCBAU 65884]
MRRIERKLGGYDFRMLWIGLIDSNKCRGSIDEINVDVLDLESHLDLPVETSPLVKPRRACVVHSRS